MGRHSRPSHTMRNTLIVSSAVAAGLGTMFATPASADINDGCTAGARNPDVRVCQDNPLLDGGSDSLHALAKVNPLLCVHAVIPDGRRVIGTRDCSHSGAVGVPVIPVVPVEPAPETPAPSPCTCTPGAVTSPAPVGVVPVVPVAPAAPVGAPTPSQTLPEAPAPTIVNNQTAGSALPAVTH